MGGDTLTGLIRLIGRMSWKENSSDNKTCYSGFKR